jgi:hypothetical protein
MRCPACKKRVIGFFMWGQGLNAFRKVDCPHCGARLQTSWWIIIAAFWIFALAVIFTIGAAEVLRALGVPESTARIIFGCIMVPSVIGSSYLVWRTGFYSLRDCNKSPKD